MTDAPTALASAVRAAAQCIADLAASSPNPRSTWRSSDVQTGQTWVTAPGPQNGSAHVRVAHARATSHIEQAITALGRAALAFPAIAPDLFFVTLEAKTKKDTTTIEMELFGMPFVSGTPETLAARAQDLGRILATLPPHNGGIHTILGTRLGGQDGETALALWLALRAGGRPTPARAQALLQGQRGTPLEILTVQKVDSTLAARALAHCTTQTP